MDNAQWTHQHQENGGDRKAILMEKRSMMMMKAPKAILNCPRCHSTNTKFCYYNNYSLTQPRYFCKTCRRYWTEGGTLRNVPVGGGSRKNSKKPVSSSTLNDPPPKLLFVDIPDLNPPPIPIINNNNNNIIASNSSHHQNPNHNKFHHDHQDHGQDLNLGFHMPHHHHHGGGGVPHFLEFPKLEGENVISPTPNSISCAPPPNLSALNFLRNGNNNNNNNIRGLNHPFMTAPNMNIISGGLDQSGSNNDAVFGGFSFQECSKPSSLDFSIDDQTEESALMFTLGGGTRRRRDDDDDDDDQQIKGSRENNINNANGFWNGMLGGGSW